MQISFLEKKINKFSVLCVGHDIAPVPHPQIINSTMIVGIAVGGVLILLILIDLMCCVFVNAGVFALMCRRAKRSPSDLEEEAKIGRWVA